MMYADQAADAPLSQGDLLDECRLVYWKWGAETTGFESAKPFVSTEPVVVLTQSCDLANDKTRRIQVAVVHQAERLVTKGLLKASTIRDQVRRHRTFGWYFLPACEAPEVPESIVDLRDVHTLPRDVVEAHVRQGHRRATIVTPYREHLAQQFALTYTRIALPQPYETE